MGVGGGVQQTPWTDEWQDVDGRRLAVSVAFTQATGVLQSAQVYRDVGCRYANILFGLGADGKPDSTPRKFAVNPGTTNITKAMLNSGGLINISDILASQITASP